MQPSKKIRLKFVGFYPRFDPQNNLFMTLLKKHFEVELVEENPDFIFCQHFGTPYEFTHYSCPRIFYSGENLSPDFNSFDYSITYDPLEYTDRHFTAPYYLFDSYAQNAFVQKGLAPLPPKEELLADKSLFCNFIFSHEASTGMRLALFDKLSEYRRVESPGIYQNNMKDHWTIPYSPDGTEKMDFIRHCKFSIVPESIDQPGFTTEKIVHAWLAHTVPIFYGNPLMDEVFNPKAYLNVRRFNSLDELLAEVKRLDQDEDAWYEMVRQPLFLEPDFFQRRTRELEEFLVHIFEQSPEQAFRRSRHYLPSEYESCLRDYNRFFASKAFQYYQKEKCKNRRLYWARHHLHRLLPSLVSAPDRSLLE